MFTIVFLKSMLLFLLKNLSRLEVSNIFVAQLSLVNECVCCDLDNEQSFTPKTEKSISDSSPLEFKKGTKSFADICGLENPGKDRIVGGHEAAENEWPWQVCVCTCAQ